ncbi:hypothetical protein [Streptomyces sp. NPDC005017]|uniref:hypothetical protein n=1 Tax=Streptomyces sp. NPDC005017 TaxID=3364706 RepID=UPI0036A80674
MGRSRPGLLGDHCSREWTVHTGAGCTGIVGYLPADCVGNASATFKNAIGPARPHM